MYQTNGEKINTMNFGKSKTMCRHWRGTQKQVENIWPLKKGEGKDLGDTYFDTTSLRTVFSLCGENKPRILEKKQEMMVLMDGGIEGQRSALSYHLQIE